MKSSTCGVVKQSPRSKVISSHWSCQLPPRLPAISGWIWLTCCNSKTCDHANLRAVEESVNTDTAAFTTSVTLPRHAVSKSTHATCQQSFAVSYIEKQLPGCHQPHETSQPAGTTQPTSHPLPCSRACSCTAACQHLTPITLSVS
jgi:hypothetical protein